MNLLFPLFCVTWPLMLIRMLVSLICKTNCIRTFAASELWSLLVLTIWTQLGHRLSTKHSNPKKFALCRWTRTKSTMVESCWSCIWQALKSKMLIIFFFSPISISGTVLFLQTTFYIKITFGTRKLGSYIKITFWEFFVAETRKPDFCIESRQYYKIGSFVKLLCLHLVLCNN